VVGILPIKLFIYDKDEVAKELAESWKCVSTNPKINLTYFGSYLGYVTECVKKWIVPNVRVLVATEIVMVNNRLAELGPLALWMVD
jgi:hypothetical protein